MTPVPDATLDLLDALHKAASPGPWIQNNGAIDDTIRRNVALVLRPRDLAAIVATHNTLPDLIAELHGYRARMADLAQSAALIGVGLSDRSMPE